MKKIAFFVLFFIFISAVFCIELQPLGFKEIQNITPTELSSNSGQIRTPSLIPSEYLHGLKVYDITGSYYDFSSGTISLEEKKPYGSFIRNFARIELRTIFDKSRFKVYAEPLNENEILLSESGIYYADGNWYLAFVPLKDNPIKFEIRILDTTTNNVYYDIVELNVSRLIQSQKYFEVCTEGEKGFEPYEGSDIYLLTEENNPGSITIICPNGEYIVNDPPSPAVQNFNDFGDAEYLLLENAKKGKYKLYFQSYDDIFNTTTRYQASFSVI